MNNISAWSIRNPVPAIVLFAALTLAGIVSFMRMSINDSPEITFPGVVVQISQPGAAPTELENQVTQRIEAAVRNLEGVDEINSTVTEGSSETFVQFTLQTPVDRATTDVRDAVSQIRGQLPDGILEPQIIRAKVNGGALANFSVEARDMTLEQLSWYVQNIVSRRLLGIEGMQSINVSGAVNREIRVILDAAKMQGQGVTASQVNAQLRAMNMNAAGGRAEIAGAEQSVRVLGNAQDALRSARRRSSSPTAARSASPTSPTCATPMASAAIWPSSTASRWSSFGLQRARGASEVTIYDEARRRSTSWRRRIRRSTSTSATTAPNTPRSQL
jgi:multidrug efflux pump subunit AcrB